MSSTEKVRQRIRGGLVEFSVKDFQDIPHISTILYKLEKEGEIRHIDRIYKTGGRALKVYRVVKLAELSAKEVDTVNKRAAARRRAHQPVPTENIWSEVYPEFFRIPDFRITGRTIHKEAY